MMNFHFVRICCISAAALAVGLASNASGAIITHNYALSAGDITTPGSPLTFSQSLSGGGVSFNAVLSVAGSGVNLHRNSDGIGVAGGTDSVDFGETLGFTLSINSVVGGTVTFDEFTEFGFHLLTGGAAFSDDSTLGGDFVTQTTSVLGVASTDLSPFNRTSFFVLPTNSISSYKAFSIAAQFTTAAVPEPSTLIAFCAVGVVAGVRRLRRRTSVA